MEYNKLISEQRRVMEQCIEKHGLSHDITIKASQKLDTILNAQAKIGVKACSDCENFVFEIEVGAFSRSVNGTACCKGILTDSDCYEKISWSSSPVICSVEESVRIIKEGFKNEKPPYWCPLKKGGKIDE